MIIWGIFVSAFLVGFSGAMMPGPMLGITIDGSMKKGFWAGPMVVVGHAILEFSLIVVMVVGLKDFFAKPVVGGCIGLFGGLFLGWMGYGMVKSSIQKTVSLSEAKSVSTKGKGFIISGLLVSATNPYFIMWWASTGMESVRQSYTIGFIGVLFFYFGHILSDFAWYSAISAAFSSGRKLISDRVYRWCILGLGAFIMAFSIYFVTSGYKMLSTLAVFSSIFK